MRDIVITIAFRMTVKLSSFRKEVPSRLIINRTTKLGLFPDLIDASLLGAIDLLFTYHDIIILQFRPKKMQ